MKAAIIGIVAIVVIAAGGYVIFHKSMSTTKSTNQPNSSSNNQIPANTIEYTSSGFNPKHITVKAGSVVTIKNTDSDAMQLDSNPHPVHTDDTDLNVGMVASGESKTFTVTKTGTFGFHNHLNPSDQGTITVE